MAEVYFQHGIAKKRKGIGENVDSLGDALKEKANCGPCGCDPVTGLWTQINAETGDLMGLWITGTGGSYTLNIDDYDDAVIAVKALCDAR